jgi:type 1 glutamine amidotransferase
MTKSGSKFAAFNAKLKIPVFAGTCCILLASSDVSSAAPPDANALAIITAAAPATAARPLKARKILVYSRANGFRHSSIETGDQAIAILGQKTKAWSTIISDDPRDFEDLSPYDAVVFVSTTGDALLPANFNDLDEAGKTIAKTNEARYKMNLLDFVNSGKGFAGIHAAADTLVGWAEYGQMIGGFFDGHPWGSGDEVTVRVEDESSPITNALKGQSMTFKEEVYQFRDPYNRTQQRVLMGLDMEKTAPINGMKRADNDYPVTWIKPQGAGRVFYCSLGHNEALYSDANILGVYLAGIQYAIGDLPADATPLAQLPALYNDPAMGEYALPQDAQKGAAGILPATLVRIYPEGDAKYRAVILDANATKPRIELTGTLQNDVIAFTGPDTDTNTAITANWIKDELTLVRGLTTPVTFRKFVRTSPTLAQIAPTGSEVLLPYSPTLTQGPKLDAWTNPNWIPMRDGSAQVRGGDNRTKREFGDMKLHVEWLTPLKPEARGQERGNSGVYLQDRYEVQVLDSFGLDSQDNDAGGIYQIGKPLVNASLPPGQWQTYDITFRAPRFYTDGSIAKFASATVIHNGIVIQKDLVIPRATGGANGPEAPLGPIRLQDHGNPVRFRNIWAQELTDQPWTPTTKPAAGN